MNKRILMMAGTLAVVAIIASFAVGYALYNGNTYSEDNTMAVSLNNRVDLLIYDDDTEQYALMSQKITVPKYEAGGVAIISGYAVAVGINGGGVTVRCDMGNSACWALIDSMTISIGGNSTVPFGKVVKQGVTVTGMPTEDPISVANGTEITLEGKTLYYTSFSIMIVFANKDISDDKNFEKLTVFEGSSFEFTFVPEFTPS